MAESGDSSPKTRADSAGPSPSGRRQRWVLLGSVLLVAACGLAYEIVAGAVSTYLLGDGVVQFGVTIGIFLTAMGVGSFASRWIERDLLAAFLVIEIWVGLLGAALAPGLLWAYAEGWPYALLLVAHLGLIGVLTGAEIPLLLRLLEREDSLRINASAVLGLDYVGALIGSLLVPMVLVPWIGSIGAGALFGVVNLAVALLGLWSFPAAFTPLRRGALLAVVSVLLVALAVGVVVAPTITATLESKLYQDPVVYSANTPYQRIVLTRWRGDLRLFLNGSLQLSSRDEYRYHEALVHPAMAQVHQPQRVLVLGGGDGCAVREVLRWPTVARVDLIDLDPAMTQLAQTLPDLVALNDGSLLDPRVHVHAADALKWLESRPTVTPRCYSGGDRPSAALEQLDDARHRRRRSALHLTNRHHESHSRQLPVGSPESRKSGEKARWDVIIMDLPDPSTPSLARLYARSSFRLILQHLAPRGALGCQATSPFFARQAYWCIADTLAAVVRAHPGVHGRRVTPYRAVVPSFGTWGFLVAHAAGQGDAAAGLRLRHLPAGLRYLNAATAAELAAFPQDEVRPAGDVCINQILDGGLARSYRRSWARFGE